MCSSDLIYFLFIYLFILVLAALGLRFCARALSSCGKRGPLFIAVRGPLTITASPAAEHRLQTRRLSSCGPRAQLLHGMWDPPRPGLEPASPALAGRFSTTAPPGKPSAFILKYDLCKRIEKSLKQDSWEIDLFLVKTLITQLKRCITNKEKREIKVLFSEFH